MKTTSPVLVIDIWSDLVCPWCWIAKKRFERGLDSFEHKNKVIINQHNFRIANNKPEIPFKEALLEKLGSQQTVEAMMSQVKKVGKTEGLNYHFDTMLFGDTEDAMTLLAAARNKGIGNEMTERLFKASVEEGRSIFNQDELISLAKEVGMSNDAASKALKDKKLRSSILADEKKARLIGASGVPLFVFNNKYAVSGAQPSDHFLNVLNQAWKDQFNKSHLAKDQGHELSCNTDGCAI